MILTRKFKHNRDFTDELVKAHQIAQFAIDYRLDIPNMSSKHVKQFGLPAAVSNQIVRKYKNNKKAKQVKRVKLTVPGGSTKLNNNKTNIYMSCFKLYVDVRLPDNMIKINVVELGPTYVYVSFTVPEASKHEPKTWLGVDLNTTGHLCVVANNKTGKVHKLGKRALHVHKKYKSIRKKLQKQLRYKRVKKLRNRESRVIRNLNHKISKKVVELALASSAGIVLEDLTNIRRTTKSCRSFRYSLHSWSFSQFKEMILYKARLHGVPVAVIDPCYTSQQCSKCGLLGKRSKKSFECPSCGHVEHADVNAAFVIGLRHEGVLDLPRDRDLGKGSTDAPDKEAPSLKADDLENYLEQSA